MLSPEHRAAARRFAHQACQWPARAARANLPPRDDDGHSSLGWDAALGALVSHAIGADSAWRVGFRFTDAALLWVHGVEVADRLALVEQQDAGAWLDARLVAQGLAPAAAVALPYDLDPGPEPGQAPTLLEGVKQLGGAFEHMHAALTGLTEGLEGLEPGPSAVRLWPHHFDMASLVSLEPGDPETARAVGMGLSPGDGSIPLPYVYCSPWPAPEAKGLGTAPAPFRWHTQGFVALVADFDGLVRNGPLQPQLAAAFESARAQLVRS